MGIAALKPPEVRTYRFVTPNAPDAPKLARDHVAWLLTHAGADALVDVAKLLVSEVVTNSHLHTTSPRISLTTTIRPSRVHIDVYDSNPLPPPKVTTRQSAHLTTDHGRGLLMVELLAAHWGCDVYGGERPFGKSVWFDLIPEQVAR